jgi:hypothetical protein
VALIALATAPVIWIETGCVSSSPARAVKPASLLLPADRREEINSYLTYPEWSVVHAYEDLAAVMRRSSESDYDYLGAIRRYWSSLCAITSFASARGAIANDYRVMLHVIGLSFAAEMGVKGLYEKTIGRVTSLFRGSRKTPEDEFALKVAEEYAAFLTQTPWYEFPFAARLGQFWSQTSLVGGNPLRKIERRIALTMEWGVKSIYAQLIGLGAATMPAAARIRSVVADLDPADMAADPRITLVRHAAQGASIIETDRYRTLTGIMQGLARRGRNLVEIAGNSNILVTVLAPAEQPVILKDATVLLDVPVQGRPGWRRIALDVKVPSLLAMIRQMEGTRLELEHVYDY